MSQNIKLPKNAIPNRYEIDLDIDLENFKYAGKETIYIEVVDDSTEIQLNSLGIDIVNAFVENDEGIHICLLYTSPSPRDQRGSRMPSSA